MSGSPIPLASDLTRSWVRLYTRGVAPDARQRRRNEIDSDLWEQTHESPQAAQTPSGTALAILARLALGIPADLSWRLEHASPGLAASRLIEGSRTMLATAKKHFMLILSGVLGLFYLAAAMGGLAANLNDGGDDAGAWVIPMALAAVLVLGGVVQWKHRPRLARILLASGAILGGVFSFWMIITPIVAVLILIWLISTRRPPAPAPV